MGYALNKQSNRLDYNLREYICDTPADLNDIPTDCEPGSTTLVISTSEVYILNTEKEWKRL